ncbi:MAG: hypothetical protein JW837_18155 [Sedimentisphaerales bacterium]|nr:hypothetical protein [Sedimentisphaerales bacterium]
MWELFVWFFWHVAAPVGLAYLGGKLLTSSSGLKDMSVPDEEGYEGRIWREHTTQAEGLARPRAYGKNQHTGNIIAKWTDVDGNDREILYLIVQHGDGPTKGIGSNTVYLNDQPSDNFGSVTIQECLGTMDQTCMTGFEKLKLEYSFQNLELFQSEPYTFTTPNDFFDDLEFTICAPNGLHFFHKSGGMGATSVGFRARIREYPSGSWTWLFNDYITAGTLTPYFKKFTASSLGFTCAKGKQYDIEFEKTSADGVSRVTNNICLRSVREVVSTAFTRPGKALIGIKAVATSQLSGNLDVKVIREDRIINTFNGVSWTLQYSRNRAWVVWDILTQPVISGDGVGTPYAIERYEGIDPQYLDLEFFYKWSLFCDEEINDGYGGTEPRCTCDIKVKEFTDTFSLAYKLAEAGRAHIYWRGDKLTGWIDDEVTTPVDLVTMDTMMHKTWKNSWAIEEELAGVVEVLYDDSRQGYERTPAYYGNEDAGGYKNIVSIEGSGITTRGAAVHLAAYHLKRNELIRNINNFRVFKEGFRYKLGDVIRLQCRMANWGRAFRVISSTADTITVDRDASAEASPGDVLHIRSYNTLLEQVVTDTYEIDSINGNEITVTENWDVTPVKGNIVAVGSASAIKLRRIIKMKPTIDNYFDAEVETYDPDLFDVDTINPDNPNPNYIWPSPAGNITNPITRAEVEDLLGKVVPPPLDINVPFPANLTWSGNSVDTVSWSKTDVVYDITFTYAGVTYSITPGSTTDKFIYWNPSSPTVFLTTNVLATAAAPGNWVMCINESGEVSYPVPQKLIHGGLIQAGTITAAYGQIADAAITTAKINNLAVTEAKIGAAAVTSAKIDNLAVTNAKIDNLAVNTLKIADDSTAINESIYTAAETTVGSTEVTVQSDTIASQGNLIEAHATIDARADAGDVWFTVFLYEGSTLLASIAEAVASGYTKAVVLSAIRYTGSGSQTFYVKAKRTSGATSFKAGSRGLQLRESLGK